MVFPSVTVYDYSIWMCSLCWSVTEIVRFTFYTLKELKIEDTVLAQITGVFRYNLFILLYPLGVSHELLACYRAWQELRLILDKGAKIPFSIYLPNKFNCSFDLEFFIKVFIPILYISIFPSLYMHMWGMRTKYYKD